MLLTRAQQLNELNGAVGREEWGVDLELSERYDPYR
jgi:hypothetical protein